MDGPKKKGGKREGAGRKSTFDEKTVPVTTRVPISRVKEFQELVKQILTSWKKIKKN
jgi:hypothetical protein